MTYRLTSLLLLTLLSVKGSAFSEFVPDILKLPLDQLFFHARQVLGQKTPSPYGYFRFGESWVQYHQGNKQALEGPFEGFNWIYERIPRNNP